MKLYINHYFTTLSPLCLFWFFMAIFHLECWAIHSRVVQMIKWLACSQWIDCLRNLGGYERICSHFPMPTNCLCWSGCFHLFSRFIITWCHPMTEPGGSTSLTSPTLKSPINVLWHLDPEATTGKAQLVKMVKDCAGAGSCSCHWPGRANLAKGPWSLLICSLGQDHKSFPLSGLLEKTSQAEKESFSLRWDGKVLRGRMPGPNTGPTTCQDLFL